MKKQEAQERIEKLRAAINRHRYEYHVLDKPEISDEAFDALKHELWLLEQQYPDLITPESPTQRVGGEPLEKFAKREHSQAMLSIEDVFSGAELKEWEVYIQKLAGASRIEYFAETKIDGLALALLYRRGLLHYGITRGNGVVGEDVTQNIKTIPSIPLRIAWRGKLSPAAKENILRGDVEVRGEVYMNVADFEAYNASRARKGEDLYANPRNLAAGSVRQLDPKLAASRPLQFIAYDIVSDLGQTLHSEEHDMLRSLGFRTDDTARICKTTEEVLGYWKKIERKRPSLQFQVDGVVVNVNDNGLFVDLGVAGKSPRGIRALKFSGKQATTKIREVTFQVGRTGAITPVAVLDPVEIYGTTISRATLHNEDEMRALGIRVGDTVIVERAGDVIPAVVRVLTDLRSGREREIRMPRQCPVCGRQLTRPEGEVIWRCSNRECSAVTRKLLRHFVSKKAFDIEGFGSSTVNQLADEHLIAEPSDIFELKEGDLVPLERFGEKSARNLIGAIEKSKNIALPKFLYALGIRHAGEETAFAISRRFRTLVKVQTASRQELEEIADIGPIVAQSIFEWFRASPNRKLVDRLLKAGVSIENEKRKEASEKLRGKTFVLTGSLETMTRDEAKKKIRALGGELSESPSAGTSYVVAGEHPGSKLERAKKLGVKVIGEKEFSGLLKGK